MGTRGTPDTPYRKGLAAGQQFVEARAAWQEAGGYRSGQPAPIRPDSPYRPDQRAATRAWGVGVDYAIQRARQVRK